MNFGKIAYMAYRECSGGKSLISGQPIPIWEELPLEIQRAWNAAADAVLLAQAPIRDAARKGFDESIESGRKQTEDDS